MAFDMKFLETAMAAAVGYLVVNWVTTSMRSQYDLKKDVENLLLASGGSPSGGQAVSGATTNGGGGASGPGTNGAAADSLIDQALAALGLRNGKQGFDIAPRGGDNTELIIGLMEQFGPKLGIKPEVITIIKGMIAKNSPPAPGTQFNVVA